MAKCFGEDLYYGRLAEIANAERQCSYLPTPYLPAPSFPAVLVSVEPQSHYSGVRWGFEIRLGGSGSESTQGGSHHIVRNLIRKHPSVAPNPGVNQSSVTAVEVIDGLLKSGSVGPYIGEAKSEGFFTTSNS